VLCYAQANKFMFVFRYMTRYMYTRMKQTKVDIDLLTLQIRHSFV